MTAQCITLEKKSEKKLFLHLPGFLLFLSRLTALNASFVVNKKLVATFLVKACSSEMLSLPWGSNSAGGSCAEEADGSVQPHGLHECGRSDFVKPNQVSLFWSL